MTIDLVYLWCNLDDPPFRARRDAWLAAHGGATADRAGTEDVRFRPHDELKYALRGAAAHCPWLNRIFLVLSDEQTPPAWLDAAHPKIRIVRHSEFVPAAFLPTWNSVVPEFFLARIPGLSERFLYANDDWMIARDVGPEFFFTRAGLPIVRYRGAYPTQGGGPYTRSLVAADRFVRERLGVKTPAFGHFPHHNVEPYLASDCVAFLDRFADDLRPTFASHFRAEGQVEHTVLSLYALAVGHAVYRQRATRGANTLSRFLPRALYRVDSHFAELGRDDFVASFRRLRPALFCLNDKAGATAADYRRMADFYARLFPAPAAWERHAPSAPSRGASPARGNF